MKCQCADCPNRGTDKCEKERLRWDVDYQRQLREAAEAKLKAQAARE